MVRRPTAHQVSTQLGDKGRRSYSSAASVRHGPASRARPARPAPRQAWPAERPASGHRILPVEESDGAFELAAVIAQLERRQRVQGMLGLFDSQPFPS